MKGILMMAALLGLGLSGTAAAQRGARLSTELGSGKQLLPVLVAVNADGKVTKVDSAVRLRSSLQRALKASVQHMILAPARDKQEKAIPSQFVMWLLVEADPDNASVPRFALDGVQPVRLGPMMWVSTGQFSHKQFGLAPYPAASAADPGHAVAERQAAAAAAQNGSNDHGSSH